MFSSHRFTLTTDSLLEFQVQTAAHIAENRLVAFYGGDASTDETGHPGGEYIVKYKRSSPAVVIYIDGKEHGNISRFINHSCDLNCEMVPYIFEETLIMAIVSIRGIKPLEFITFNYGESYTFIKLCLCGSPICRKRPEYLQWLHDRTIPIHFFCPTTL